MSEYKKKFLRGTGIEYTMEFYDDFVETFNFSPDDLVAGDIIHVIRGNTTYIITINDTITVEKIINEEV